MWRMARRGIERPRELSVEQRPGINVELTQYDASELERVLSDVAGLGFTWLRQHFPWQAIEVAPGIYEWERWDAVVEATRRHNLRLIAVVDTFPEWARRQDKYPLPCEPPCSTDAFGHFASVLAGRYADAIDYYQIWDEPNLSQSWGGGQVAPCGYAALLEAAYRAVHGADPSAWVLGGGLAPTQAPGPDNLNDLTYLRGLYAAGGGPYLDILAAKPYGFWSGPEDRRVAPDVLNYSRAVAWREIMRTNGDARKPIWAVEWGWHVEQAGRHGEMPPWGTDTLAVQQERILEAVRRARREWPWMGVMCWAEYQPAVAATSAQWGFALASSDGSPTGLHEIIRVANSVSQTGSIAQPWRPDALSMRWGALLLLMLLAVADLGVLWHVGRCGATLLALGRWWYSLHPLYHVLGLALLAVLYVLTPMVEWIIVELVLAAIILWAHPSWALLGAVFGIPFFYWAKAVGDVRISPNETWLSLAVVVQVLHWWSAVRRSQGGRARTAEFRKEALGQRGERSRVDWLRPVLSWGLSPLDVAWVAWVVLGALSPQAAPDPSLAWREWRLCMLEPALLYGLLRWEGQKDSAQAESLPRKILLAWLASGVVVALFGMVQWATGTSVAAGVVGRALGTYYSPNHLALYLERLWPLALIWAGHGARRWRLMARIAAAVLGACLYMTFSRGAWLLAVPVALAVLCIHYRDRLRWWAYVGAAGLSMLAMVSVLYGRQTPVAALREELRWSVWRSALEMIRDHPWRGVGLDGFQFVYPKYMRIEAWTEPLLYHPHNMWLDAAVRLGLPGLALFVGLTAACAYEMRRMLTSRGTGLPELAGSEEPWFREAVAVGCLAGLLAAIAHGMVDSGYFLVDLAWSLGLMAGTVTGRPVHACSSRPRDVAGDMHA
jgi:O-antigen ligase